MLFPFDQTKTEEVTGMAPSSPPRRMQSLDQETSCERHVAVELVPQRAVPAASQTSTNPQILRDFPDDVPAMAVARFPINIRNAFRFKMLSLVFLNALGIMGITLIFAYVPALANGLGSRYSNTRQSLVMFSMFALFGSFCVLGCFKDQFPKAYFAFVLFTCLCGFFFGVSHPLWGSLANLQIVGYIVSISLFFLILSTWTWPPSYCIKQDIEAPGDQDEERQYVLKTTYAAFLAWLINLVLYLVLNSMTHFSDSVTAGFLQFFAFLLAIFFAKETKAIELQVCAFVAA